MTGADGAETERTGLARAASADALTFRGLVQAVGGVLGIVESVVPPLLFVVLYQVAAIRAAPAAVARPALVPIVLVPLLCSVALLAYRLLRRQSARAAIGGGVVVAVSAVLVLATGDANANYLPGFVINIVYGLAFLVSLLVGRPLVGVAVGVLMGDGGWRDEPAKRRLSARLTALWVALFAIRLIVEVPLFLAGDQVVALGIARIVLGLPLYAIVLVLTVLGVQTVQTGRRDGTPEAPTAP